MTHWTSGGGWLSRRGRTNGRFGRRARVFLLDRVSGEIFRDKRTTVNRPEKAHLFFPNVGWTSTQIQTFGYIPLRFLTMRSPLAMSVTDGTPLAFWSQETGCVHDFPSHLYSGAGVFRVLDVLVLSLVPGIDRPLRNRWEQAPARPCHPSV
jgi:hypothetical protein